MFELIFLLILGLVFLFIGYRLWIKEQITLMHSYHYANVSDSDKKAYTKQMGISILIIGFGLIANAVVNYFFNTQIGWLVFILSFIVSAIIFVSAQKKYNGGIFS